MVVYNGTQQKITVSTNPSMRMAVPLRIECPWNFPEDVGSATQIRPEISENQTDF